MGAEAPLEAPQVPSRRLPTPLNDIWARRFALRLDGWTLIGHRALHTTLGRGRPLAAGRRAPTYVTEDKPKKGQGMMHHLGGLEARRRTGIDGGQMGLLHFGVGAWTALSSARSLSSRPRAQPNPLHYSAGPHHNPHPRLLDPLTDFDPAPIHTKPPTQARQQQDRASLPLRLAWVVKAASGASVCLQAPQAGGRRGQEEEAQHNKGATAEAVNQQHGNEGEQPQRCDESVVVVSGLSGVNKSMSAQAPRPPGGALVVLCVKRGKENK